MSPMQDLNHKSASVNLSKRSLIHPNTPKTANSFFYRKFNQIHKPRSKQDARNHPYMFEIKNRVLANNQQLQKSGKATTNGNIDNQSPISRTPTTARLVGNDKKSTPKRSTQRYKYPPLVMECHGDSSSDCDTIANLHEANLKNNPRLKQSQSSTPSLFSLPRKRRDRASIKQMDVIGTPKSRLSSNFNDKIPIDLSDEALNIDNSILTNNKKSPDAGNQTESQTGMGNILTERVLSITDGTGVHEDISSSKNLVTEIDCILIDSEDDDDVSNTSLMTPIGSPRPFKFIDKDELPFSINDLNRWPRCPLRLKPLESNKNTLVFFQTISKDEGVPVPTPRLYKNIKGDQLGEFVLLPCDSANIIDNGDGESISKWELIVSKLRNITLGSIDQLERIIKDLNPTYSEFNFNVLRDVLDSVSDKMASEFLNNLLPNIVQLALSLKETVTQPVPLLRQESSKTLVLSQKQVACLMANAFLCLYPKRNSSFFRNYPDINFWRLFTGSNLSKVEKLKCVINYFKRVTDTDPTGVISFTRMSLKQEDVVRWSESLKPLPRVAISLDGRIEREGRGMLQVDFANQMIGGGILANGCVQEEIMFAICPEMIISRLFCERLLDYEVVFITGAEQYSTYEGYADSFKWKGNFVDETPLDKWSRRMHRVVAMDAKMFTRASHHNQFKPTYIDRELNKAYCGFNESKAIDRDEKVAVATGNWGCGVFGGDKQLKFIIQLLAASQAERDILYFTFGDKTLKKDIQNIYNFLIERRSTVSTLYKVITSYFESLPSETDLFSYLKASPIAITDSHIIDQDD